MNTSTSEALTVACPTCGAKPGERCWSSGLRFGPREPHRSRAWVVQEPDRKLTPELHSNWRAGQARR